MTDRKIRFVAAMAALISLAAADLASAQHPPPRIEAVPQIQIPQIPQPNQSLQPLAPLGPLPPTPAAPTQPRAEPAPATATQR